MGQIENIKLHIVTDIKEIMDTSSPHIRFEVEKVIGVSSDGTYRVQWSPAWVSSFHLIGCEHLIQEFHEQQQQQQQQQQQIQEQEQLKVHQQPLKQQQQQLELQQQE